MGGHFPNLEKRLAAMCTPPEDPDRLFHAITLTADLDGRVNVGTHSEWVGYQDEDRRVEIRQSRLVYASYARTWDIIGEPYVFVLCDDDLLPFLVAGGHALVEHSIAASVFSHAVRPHPSYPMGRLGYVGRNLLEPTALRRAPSPKLRMTVLKRDRRRCRICGRNPDDNSDLVLHIHHIRPWKNGGITDLSNLITLCHTCHTGLDPHHDVSLYSYVEQSDGLSHSARFEARVANYRRVGFCSEE